MEKFISDSTDALSKQPRTVDEIGEAKAAYSVIVEKSSNVRILGKFTFVIKFYEAFSLNLMIFPLDGYFAWGIAAQK